MFYRMTTGTYLMKHCFESKRLIVGIELAFKKQKEHVDVSLLVTLNMPLNTPFKITRTHSVTIFL